MPTESLPIGPAFKMLAGVTYALPAVSVSIFTDLGAAALTMSTNAAFTNSIAVTLTGGSVDLNGGFIKAAADTWIVLKRN